MSEKIEKSLLLEAQKNSAKLKSAKLKSEGFTIDKMAGIWESATKMEKYFLLLAAKLDSEQKYWGGYTKQEQRAIFTNYLCMSASVKTLDARFENFTRLQNQVNARD